MILSILLFFVVYFITWKFLVNVYSSVLKTIVIILTFIVFSSIITLSIILAELVPFTSDEEKIYIGVAGIVVAISIVIPSLVIPKIHSELMQLKRDIKALKKEGQ